MTDTRVPIARQVARAREVAAATTERVGIYCRISDDPRQKEAGVGRQKADGLDLAARRGWDVVGVFTDNDIQVLRPGAARPDFDRMMAAIARGEITRIVAYGLARLVRNRRERAELIEFLARHRVSITLVKGGEIDLTSAAGRAVMGLLGEMDTMESEIKAERVARASLERAEEGRASAHVLYGWRREYVRTDTGAVLSWQDVPCELTAPVVARIVDELLERRSLREVANGLNADGILPPRRHLREVNGLDDRPALKVADRWQTSTVRKIALRPANVGVRMRDRQEFGQAAWPAIVDRDKHDRVVALLTDPGRTTAKSGLRKHLLTYGIGVCPNGHPLRVHARRASRPTHAPQVMYACDTSHHGGGTACVGRNQAKVDALVADVVIGRLSRPDAADLLARDDTDAADARDRAAHARAKLAQLQDDHDEDVIDREQYLRGTKRWRAVLAEAETLSMRAVQGVDRELIGRLVGGETRFDWDEARAVWDDELTITQRRALMIALGTVVTIGPSTTRGTRFDPTAIVVRFGQDVDALGMPRTAA
jgi:site-specific DNA recombinase